MNALTTIVGLLAGHLLYYHLKDHQYSVAIWETFLQATGILSYIVVTKLSRKLK
jgi:hypothetical protein